VKVVLDTNVLLSGLMFPGSLPGRIIGAWDETRFEVALSLPQLEEIARVLSYPKIRRRLKWDDQVIEQFVKQLYVRVEMVDLKGTPAVVPSDPDDAVILATLIAAKADILVTGDADLLALRDRYPIETPAEFVRRL
jgi:uncharacterized protein